MYLSMYEPEYVWPWCVSLVLYVSTGRINSVITAWWKDYSVSEATAENKCRSWAGCTYILTLPEVFFMDSNDVFTIMYVVVMIYLHTNLYHLVLLLDINRRFLGHPKTWRAFFFWLTMGKIHGYVLSYYIGWTRRGACGDSNIL